jgi:hypothetical protein
MQPACVDSDNGKDYYTKGTANDGSMVGVDTCDASGNLIEYYCSSNQVLYETHQCSLSETCSNGTCISQVFNVTILCTDSDGGANSLVAGFVTYAGLTYKDTCIGSTGITEYYCTANGAIASVNIECATLGQTCFSGTKGDWCN